MSKPLTKDFTPTAFAGTKGPKGSDNKLRAFLEIEEEEAAPPFPKEQRQEPAREIPREERQRQVPVSVAGSPPVVQQRTERQRPQRATSETDTLQRQLAATQKELSVAKLQADAASKLAKAKEIEAERERSARQQVEAQVRAQPQPKKKNTKSLRSYTVRCDVAIATKIETLASAVGADPTTTFRMAVVEMWERKVASGLINS